MVIEKWLPIDGFEGLYEISNLGRVKSCERVCGKKSRRIKEKILKGGAWGVYLSITLCKEGVRFRKNIQWLVASAFIGPRPDGLEVCHNNSVHHDNSFENLRYDTRAGNFSDKIKNGTSIRGEMHPKTKLTAIDVVYIRSMSGFCSQQDVADYFDMTQSAIGKIMNRNTWGHI